MAKFLKELQAISDILGPKPGQHNWWRGDHISVYDQGAREQIAQLANIINSAAAIDLWDQALCTKWSNTPVWIHGDFAIGNILMLNGKLSSIIDFGGCAIGDPACDIVIAWTYLSGKARDIFYKMALDADTLLRARAWALWKATFELCQIKDKNNPQALNQEGLLTMCWNKYYTDRHKPLASCILTWAFNDTSSSQITVMQMNSAHPKCLLIKLSAKIVQLFNHSLNFWYQWLHIV